MKRCPNTFFTCPQHLQHWYNLCVESIVGGFSSPLAQTRVEVGQTKISPDVYGDRALTCQAFEVQDFNSLYPAMMSVSRFRALGGQGEMLTSTLTGMLICTQDTKLIDFLF